MLTGSELKGVIPAVVTPFTPDDCLDEEGLANLIDYLLTNGVHGIMCCGGNGEFPHLLREEKRRVVEVVVSVAKGQIPVIAGTAACSTREAILLSQDAQDAGADAVIITAPYYFKLPEQSLYDHYATIARHIDLPIVVYNNPLYTGNPMPPTLLACLAFVDGIIGLKQSEADMGQLVQVIQLLGDSEIAPAGKPFSVCTGIDSQFFPALCVGCVGIYSTAACVVPKPMVELYNAFVSGQVERAREIHHRLQALNYFFEYDPGYVAPCKEALKMLGLPAGKVRSPMPELTEDEKENLRRALKEVTR